MHYHPDKPALLACDSSEYGFSAVWVHVIQDGWENQFDLFHGFSVKP